jgi:hypothetical protein
VQQRTPITPSASYYAYVHWLVATSITPSTTSITYIVCARTVQYLLLNASAREGINADGVVHASPKDGNLPCCMSNALYNVAPQVRYIKIPSLSRAMGPSQELQFCTYV